MPFLINPNCKCCKDMLWHCEKEWNLFHNGQKHKDYEPPEYYGQPMNEDIDKKLKEEFGIEFTPLIKANKNKAYIEEIYH